VLAANNLKTETPDQLMIVSLALTSVSDLDKIVVVSFDDDSKPYRALRTLTSLSGQGRARAGRRA
jgi:hypothetical protein